VKAAKETHTARIPLVAAVADGKEMWYVREIILQTPGEGGIGSGTSGRECRWKIMRAVKRGQVGKETEHRLKSHQEGTFSLKWVSVTEFRRRRSHRRKRETSREQI